MQTKQDNTTRCLFAHRLYYHRRFLRRYNCEQTCSIACRLCSLREICLDFLYRLSTASVLWLGLFCYTLASTNIIARVSIYVGPDIKIQLSGLAFIHPVHRYPGYLKVGLTSDERSVGRAFIYGMAIFPVDEIVVDALLKAKPFSVDWWSAWPECCEFMGTSTTQSAILMYSR